MKRGKITRCIQIQSNKCFPLIRLLEIYHAQFNFAILLRKKAYFIFYLLNSRKALTSAKSLLYKGSSINVVVEFIVRNE